MALGRAQPAPGLIVHSDRGSEFANAKFHGRAAEARIRLSMSGRGNCYDNAAAESFFATVKLEAIPEGSFASRQQARRALFDYIEVFYNRQREVFSEVESIRVIRLVLIKDGFINGTDQIG